MADRETARLEAAARHGFCAWPEEYDTLSDAGRAAKNAQANRVLSAADKWDRDNGYVTIRLDDALQDRLADSIGVYYGAPECRNPALAATVLSALREAARRG